MRRVIKQMAAGGFVLTLSVLVPFWVVEGTDPSGRAVMWALCGAAGAFALIWAAASVRFRRSLVHRVEALIREGMKVLAELSDARPSARIELGVSPAAMAPVYAFDDRVRALLRRRCPSALKVYADEGSASLAHARRHDASRQGVGDLRTAVAEWREQPSVELEARLDGLAAVVDWLRPSERRP